MPTIPWTPADIPDQKGRRAIITGANSGLGFYTALELARHGAEVVLAVRERAKGEFARTRILHEIPQSRLEVAALDLASLASVRAFAAVQLDKPLHLLINNAGVMAPPKRTETADGMELQFGTNVAGHFALTALLLPALTSVAAGTAPPPRIVTLASIAHKRARLDFADLQSRRRYSPMRAYQQSKLADLMFSLELDRRLRAAGSPIVSVAAHPGVSNTNLFHSGVTNPIQRRLRRGIGAIMDAFLNSQQEAAIPSLFAATAPEAEDGGYYGPQGLAETRGGDVGPAKVAPRARDAAAAQQLWKACEELTGLRFL